jgi:hypothetical protein
MNIKAKFDDVKGDEIFFHDDYTIKILNKACVQVV